MALEFRSVVMVVALTPMAGCTYTFSDSEKVVASIPVGTVKPELDYSNDQPDCETTAQRIADNVQVGMTLADVRRLVGSPRVILPGSWWWTEGFSTKGRPHVRYPFGPSGDDVPVTSVSTDTSNC